MELLLEQINLDCNVISFCLKRVLEVVFLLFKKVIKKLFVNYQ